MADANKGYREVDSYTTADGTKYSAIAGSGGTRIIKTDASGKRTYLASTKKDTSRSTNAATVQKQFASFKQGLEKAEAGEQLTYSEADVKTDATAGRGILGQKRDTASTITLSDGTKLSAIYGKTSDEVKTVKRLADEIGAAYIEKEEELEGEGEEGEDDDGTRLEGADEAAGSDIVDETNIELGDTDEANAAEEALSEVGQGAAAAFGGSTVGDITQDTESFTNVASILSGGGMAGDAAGGQAEKEAAISVGPAEDEAVEMYAKGRRATIATGPRGLLTGDDEEEDPRLRQRRSLLAG
jgi:hypothetical protein